MLKGHESRSKFFHDKKILVTGGSSGIGKALAHGLLKFGAKVIIVSDRIDKLELVIEEFKTEGFGAIAIQCDLGKSDEIAKLVGRVNDEFGSPDIIINNAGFAVYRTFEQSSLDEIERLMDVNLLGAMILTKHFLSDFIHRNSGVVVNIASIAGTLAITPNGTYCAAKHGLVAWSECLRYELARFNININVICPGRVLTSFFDHETFQTRAARPETDYTLSMEDVVDGTFSSIVKNRFITYIPKTLGVLSRLKAGFPLLVDPFYRRLMHGRIESIYKQKLGENEIK